MYLRILSRSVAFLALLLAGCESSLKERFAEVPPKTQEFEASVEQVYSAAQSAFKQHDFKIIWKSLGSIDAASAINHSLAMGNSRQLTVKLRFRESSPGKTAVEMWLTQDVAGEGYGATYRKPLPESDFYALYFSTLQHFLEQGAAQLSAEKK